MYEHQENERGELVPSSGWIGLVPIVLQKSGAVFPDRIKTHCQSLHLTPRIPRRRIPLLDVLALYKYFLNQKNNQYLTKKNVTEFSN